MVFYIIYFIYFSRYTFFYSILSVALTDSDIFYYPATFKIQEFIEIKVLIFNNNPIIV